MALAGYAGLLFGHRQGLEVQAGIIVAIVVVVGLRAGSTPLRVLAAFPRPVRLGLGLYAAAALWGAGVGVLSGNPTWNVVGQLVAMLLLLVAALAFAVNGGLSGDTLGDAMATASLVALAIHLVVPLVAPELVSPLDGLASMKLRFGTTFSGVGVLALAVNAARLFDRRSSLQVLGFLAACVLVAGGLSRGAWISSACGLVVVSALLWRRGRGSLKWLAALAAGLGVAVAAVVITAADGARELARVDLGRVARAPSVQSDGTSSPPSVADALSLDAGLEGKVEVVLDAPCEGVAGIEVSAWLRGPEGGGASLLVAASDGQGNVVRRWENGVSGTGSWALKLATPSWPASATRLKVGLWVTGGTWLADDVEVRTVASSPARLARLLVARASSLGVAARRPVSDDSVRYRLDELDAVIAQWSHASAWRLVAGQGLGARFPFAAAIWTDDGRPASAPVASYIHNVYLFFGFKLGLAGVVALGGILLIAAWTAASAFAAGRGSTQRWLLAAGAASWVSYLVWGVTSPEIIDFRVAPLLGALVAATSLSGGASPPGEVALGRDTGAAGSPAPERHEGDPKGFRQTTQQDRPVRQRDSRAPIIP